MKMQWFRMYHEMIEDPKIGTLNDAEFRLWVEILCLSCATGNCGDTELTLEELNWKLRRNVSETLQKLLDRNLVEFKDGRKGYTVKVVNWEKRQFTSDSSTARVRKYREKQNSKNETFQKRSSNALDTDTDTDKKIYCPPSESNRIPYQEIVSYLNSKSNKNFRPTTKQTKSAIKARWNEGFRFDDFMRVIDVKCHKWAGDAKMVDYLRPQTLFGTKFEAYLNELGPVREKLRGVNPDA